MATQLGTFLDAAGNQQKPAWPEAQGVWDFDDADYTLYALLCDPITCAELLCEDPVNRDYHGMYMVRDYQYDLNRGTGSRYQGAACARSTGKTESIKNRAMTHPFRRMGENLLITTPELIHLLPLTDAIEDRFSACRLTREFLDTEAGRTGFSHRPFGVDFADGTKIVGRIPRIKGPQPVDARILTPSGWTTMGEIQPGDMVIGSEGKPIEVLGATNTWEDDVFLLSLTDGSSAEATADHWWEVSVNHGAQASKRLLQTRDIAQALAGAPKQNGGSGNMYRVPNPPRVAYTDFPEPPPLDPYVVGALLGDGAISGLHARFICADAEILDAFSERLPAGCRLHKVPQKDYAYSIVCAGRGQENPLMTGLRKLGLQGHTAHTKFVPDRYRFGSVNERVELLRGILDTDGSAKDTGSACLASASRQMVEDVVEIARSLGGWASSSSEHRVGAQVICADGKEYAHPGGTYWRAHLRVPGVQIFRLSRKAERYMPDMKTRHRSIRSVEPIGRRQVRCIKVAADDGLYLTNDMIVTHNTGVKGQHQPDLIVDEAQDYPEAGWTEVHESLRDDELIPTPTGFRRMDSLEVGEYVFGSDSRPTLVLGVFPQGERQAWRVTFSDGTWLDCDEEHLWTVRPRTERNWRVRRTSELRVGYQIPQLDHPLGMETKGDHGIDPYVLGLLIGDGSFTRNALYFSTADAELVEAIRTRLHHDEELVHVTGYDYRLRSRGTRNRHTVPPTWQAIRDYQLAGKLAHEKSIPTSYLGSPHRLALLQGLVDSDGSVSVKGAVRFVTTSPMLAAQVAGLVQSLGGRCRTHDRKDKRGFRDSWELYFRLPDGMNPARLRRKSLLVRPSTTRRMQRTIVNVEKCSYKTKMRCIEVEAANGLFVASPRYVVTHNTVMKDHVDQDGNPDFSYLFYGVHSGARDTGFYKRTTQGGFKITQVTAIQRPGWGKREKEAAKAAYGGTSSPDYRRNILGEPGSASSPLFSTARLTACMDQNRDSDYNTRGYVVQEIRAEQFDELMLPIADVLDLPSGLKRVWAGADLGLTNSPTVITIWNETKIANQPRLQLVRRIHLERMRVKTIRHAIYAIFEHFGEALQGFGMDETGLGFPIFQEIEDDEFKPDGIMGRFRGWFFNSKVPVGVEKAHLTQDSTGNWKDQYGAAVEVRINPDTNEEEYVVRMPMIEASTRYLREFVDTTFFMLPFDTAVMADMMGETGQRVKRIAGLKQKPNAFHILDSERAMAMSYHALRVEEQMAVSAQRPVLEVSM